MHEGFIHYIWQFQYFDKKELTTSQGESIEIFKPGLGNTHSGPDFSNATIRIGGIEWVGTVEIHVRSSGWMDHHHDTDPAYENVILHVVWQDDRPIVRADATLLPTVAIGKRVDPSLIQLYRKLVGTSFAVPCKRSFHHVENVVKRAMMDRVLTERLAFKSAEVLTTLHQHQGNWQQTAFIILARNFGFKINNDPFFQLAQSLPYTILLKHTDQPIQLEALLFGQAGFLDDEVGDTYYKLLRREYKLLSQKYALRDRKLIKAQWRYLRMRPANFPTVRLAQFASLLASRKNFCSGIFEAMDVREYRDLFSVTPREYWQNHYRFNWIAKNRSAGIGESSIDNILINTVAPLLVAYGKYCDQQPFIDRAIHILEFVSPEKNNITKRWDAMGYPPESAFDSQAMIELYNTYCQKRNCLNCAVGASLLKPT